MGCANEFSRCSICGYEIYDWSRYDPGPITWNPSLWIGTAIALRGPHEQWCRQQQVDHLSEQITQHAARACPDNRGYLQLISGGQSIELQNKSQPDHRDTDGDPTGLHWYLGVHDTCLTMASLVMQTSPTSRLRSLRDLWVTLDRRCEVTERVRKNQLFHFLPLIPLPKRPEEARRRWGDYYIPDYHPGSYHNWWLDDPLVIPDLTSRLLSNLQLVEPHTARPGSLQMSLDSLPQELQDRIMSLLLEETIGLECTRMLPQSCWRQLFVRIPFLWDLDKCLVSEFKDRDGKEWDWEKLFRQVMARVQHLSYPENSDIRAWNYDEVGLDVPPGFINRRRIWQLLEDMDPDEVEKYGLGELEDGTTAGEDDMPWETTSDVEAWPEQHWGPVLEPSEIVGSIVGSDLKW